MRGLGSAAASAVGRTFQGIVESYRLGGRTLLLAPAIVALSALPEFAQHVTEISMGMFDSRAAAHALANSPVRWGFGYVKIAGLIAAMLLAARFWAFDANLRRASRIAPMALACTAGTFVAMIATGAACVYLARLLPPVPALVLSILGNVLQAAMLIWVIGTLIEDPDISLRAALTTRLPTALVLVILFFAVFLPGQLLHRADHLLAFERPHALVWALMLFDSLVVGMMAVTAGAALHVGYRLGATWRGWAPRAAAPAVR